MRGVSGTEQKLVIHGSKTASDAVDGVAIANHLAQTVINLDHGDPTMYESYWEDISKKCDLCYKIQGFQALSYISNGKSLCWFLEPRLEEEIRKLHNNVGNAVVENRHIVVGTGSSQLILAALYALSEPLNEADPISVVSATPYYSCYPEMADILRSGLFKWSGDARTFDKDGPYIEMVTTPNNPDGAIREPLVNRAKGMVVHDLAYYWPHYTAITSTADHDVMLFTMSKCTGHAGSRIGWAVVRDEKVARKMVKFIEVNTIGVSKEAQLRAATILEIISRSCQRRNSENFFERCHHLMAARWKRLRDAISNNDIFRVSKFPRQYCNFAEDFTETYPAFAWLKCKDGIDCEKVLQEHKITTRGGRRFGSNVEYARVSMLSRDQDFDLFLHRIQNIEGTAIEN